MYQFLAPTQIQNEVADVAEGETKADFEDVYGVENVDDETSNNLYMICLVLI